MSTHWERISNVLVYLLPIFRTISDVFSSDGCSNTESKAEIGLPYKEHQACDRQSTICDRESPSSKHSLSSPVADNEVGTVVLFGVPIVCLYVENRERLCLAQISNTLLRNFSYNEIHNRRVALGITCLQCTPVQLEILRRTGAMPVSSRRCGLITKREAERLVKSFLEEIPPPKLPENFSFKVHHSCGWGCQGLFLPSRYNSSRAKCIKCTFCNSFFSPNKFIFHYHKTSSSSFRHPDAANFNSWRRHLHLNEPSPSDSLQHAWEDVKSMFNGGCRKRSSQPSMGPASSPNTAPLPVGPLTQSPFDHLQTMPTGVNQFNSYIGPTVIEPEQTDRQIAHPSFQSNFPGNMIGSYGDILRSLSMHYTPWWKSMYLTGQPYPHCNSVPLPINMPCINYPSMILSSNDSNRSSTREGDLKFETSGHMRSVRGENKKQIKQPSADPPSSTLTRDVNQFIEAEATSPAKSKGEDDRPFNYKPYVSLT